MNFENFVLNGELIKPSKQLLQKLDHLLLEMCELGNIDKKYGHILELINNSLFTNQGLQLVEGYKVADQVVGLSCLNIEHSLVVERLTLYHFTMVQAYAEERKVHNLTESKLD